MANNLGDFDASAVIYGKFVSCRADTGAPATLTSGALSVYKDNSTTQSTTGVTFTGDFDSVTGLNHFTIDTSADGTFYAAGSFFDVVVTTGTVNSVSAVGSCVGAFTMRKTSPLKPATAGRTLVVDAAGLADANVVKLGPTGSGTAQTARDIGASVLLSTGTGTGQLDFTSGRVKTQTNVTKNTALAGFTFVMTDSTTHAPKTGLTVTSQRSLNGGAFASTTNSATEVANGEYTIDLSAADMNANTVMLRFTATAADDLFIEILTTQ